MLLWWAAKNEQFSEPPHPTTHLFNDEKPANDFDVYMRTRLDYALNVLIQYGHALKQVRESGCVDVKKYPYGM